MMPPRPRPAMSQLNSGAPPPNTPSTKATMSTVMMPSATMATAMTAKMTETPRSVRAARSPPVHSRHTSARAEVAESVSAVGGGSSAAAEGLKAMREIMAAEIRYVTMSRSTSPPTPTTPRSAPPNSAPAREGMSSLMELRELAGTRCRSSTRLGMMEFFAGMKNMETVASAKATT